MLVASVVGLAFFSCTVDSDDGRAEKKESFVFDSRVKGLDVIFGTSKLGETKLTVKRSEWNKLLSNYDLNPKNEDCVHADYSFKKGNYSWDIKDMWVLESVEIQAAAGLRLMRKHISRLILRLILKKGL